MGEKVCERRLFRQHDSFVLTIPKTVVEERLKASEGQSIRFYWKGDRVVLVAGGGADGGEGMDKYEKALDRVMGSAKAGSGKRRGGGRRAGEAQDQMSAVPAHLLPARPPPTGLPDPGGSDGPARMPAGRYSGPDGPTGCARRMTRQNGRSLPGDPGPGRQEGPKPGQIGGRVVSHLV